MDSNPIGFFPPTPSIKGLSSQKKDQGEEGKLRAAAEGFEGYFIYTLLKEMQKTVPKGNLFGSGTGGDIYQHLFHQALSDKIAGENGLGFSKMLVDHLHQQQERRTTAEEAKEIKLTPLHSKPFYPIGR